MPKSPIKIALLLAALSLFALVAAALGGAGEGSWEYTSSPYYVNKLYASMRGPGEVKPGIQLGGSDDDLLWLTGYEATMLDETGSRQLGQDFMCHNSLFLDGTVEDYRTLLGTRPYGSPRVFTLAQGAYRLEFPAGFAMPFPACQGLQLQSQVLNLIPEHTGTVVRHHIRAEFVNDASIWRKPKPLFLVEATGRALLYDPGAQAPSAELKAAGRTRTDRQGRIWTGHWQVRPGQQHLNTTRVTDELALPFDTTAHYITSHLHPYARWQELRDVTEAGRVVYRVEPTSSADGRSLARIPFYSSAEGLQLYASHQYELVTMYDNPTNQPVTAMSILFLYCLDREFQGFDPANRARVTSNPAPLRALDESCGAETEAVP